MLSPDLEMNVSCTDGRMFSSSSCPKANCWLVVLIFVVTKKLMKTLLYSSLVCPYVPVFVFVFIFLTLPIKFSLYLTLMYIQNTACSNLIFSQLKGSGHFAAKYTRISLFFFFSLNYLSRKMLSTPLLPLHRSLSCLVNMKYPTHLECERIPD